MNLQTIWDGIPGPFRTVLNVTASGALSVVALAIYQKQGISGVDWVQVKAHALDAAGLGFSTAVLRYVNPLDKVYGVGVSGIVKPWVPDLVSSADPAPDASVDPSLDPSVDPSAPADPSAPDAAPVDAGAAFVPGATQ